MNKKMRVLFDDFKSSLHFLCCLLQSPLQCPFIGLLQAFHRADIEPQTAMPLPRHAILRHRLSQQGREFCHCVRRRVGKQIGRIHTHAAKCACFAVLWIGIKQTILLQRKIASWIVFWVIHQPQIRQLIGLPLARQSAGCFEVDIGQHIAIHHQKRFIAQQG